MLVLDLTCDHFSDLSYVRDKLDEAIACTRDIDPNISLRITIDQIWISPQQQNLFTDTLDGLWDKFRGIPLKVKY